MKPLKYWNPEGFEISSYRYPLKERVNRTYTTSGSDNTNLCTYTYNELGFRGDSIKKEGFKVMSLGCSITEGVGVNDDETWPAQFCKKIENSVNFNFGTGGRSNDFICRCLMSYYDLIKPDLVLIMYTFPHRREIYTGGNEIEPYIPTNVWGRLLETEEGKIIQSSMDILQNENSDFINWYKNHLLIKYFLESKKCNWVWNGSHGVDTEYKESNRFDGDYSFILDKGVDGTHPGPFHNMKYSENLFDHIKNNFPEYLPE
jgi:hypothetical protein